jgi:low affinity Fe/Cu permease
MSRALVLRLLIAFLGLVFILLTIWAGNIYHFSFAVTLVIMLSFGLATFLAEIIIIIDNLEKRIKRLFPALDLSAAEQASINETLDLYVRLKKSHSVVSTRIALLEFENIHKMLSAAERGSDYIFHDIYLASMVLLGSLEPGQTFKVVSNLSKRFYWKTGIRGTEHTELNMQQARKGIKIQRIFVLYSRSELLELEEVFHEQASAGIDVYYAFRENLESILPYASFAISEDLCTGIVSHRQDILGKVTVTTNSEWISELSTRFEEIRVASENFRLQ